MVHMGLDTVASLGNHLIRIFASCGCLLEASQTFFMISKPSVHSWTAIISAHTEFGKARQALRLYVTMQEAGIAPDKVVVLCTLRACSIVEDSEYGRLLHHQILEIGLESDLAIGSALIAAYTNGKYLEDARKVFDKVSNADEVIWGAMIAGYAASDQGLAALDLFEKMQHEGIKTGEVIYTCILKACGTTGEVRQGRIIHKDIIEAGLESKVHVGSSVIDMYGKCGNLEDARKVFDRFSKRNIVSWGAMIGAYIRYGDGNSGLELFARMQQDFIKPDKLIYVYALRACEISGAVKECRSIHDQIIRDGLNSETLISHTLVEVYLMCGSLAEGNKSFDLLPSRSSESWNALITGYAAGSHADFAVELFDQVEQERVPLNSVLFLSFLKACANAGATQKGRQVHVQIVKRGLESDAVIGSSLIDMYAKGGCLVEAHKVFDKLSHSDVVLWGAMISAYSAIGNCSSVCALYEKMCLKGIKPDKVIFLCLLKACGSTGSLEQARMIHCQIIRTKLECDIAVGNTIVDMYAKCGSLDEAKSAFFHLPRQDEVSWAAVIGGYVKHGFSSQASKFLDGLLEGGLRPLGVFTNLLAASSHAGLLEDGLQYFKSMVDVGIAPDIEQYSCMVDLLCRKGHLDNAKDLLQTMPFMPDILVWISLLTSCRTYGELEIGRQCFDHLMSIDLDDASGLVLMWNLYADAHSWDDIDRIVNIRKHTSVQRQAGLACIEFNNEWHEFLAGYRNPMAECVPCSLWKEGLVPLLHSD